MARTQPKGLQVRDDSLTGADIYTNLGLYDETYAYGGSERCMYNAKVYEVYSGHTITPSNSGDISNSPSVNTSDWFEIIFDEDTPHKVVLLNNVTNGKIVVGNITSDRAVIVEYSVDRNLGAGVRYSEGVVRILHDGTSAIVDWSYQDFSDDLGITFAATINGNDIELDYTTTNAGAGAQSHLMYQLDKKPIY